MKGKLIIASLAIAITSVLYFACSETEGSGNKAETTEKVRSVSVEVSKLEGEKFTDYISVVGTVQPFQKAKLSSDEGGKIKEFKKDKGSYVQKGEVILVIDNDVLKANLDAAKAQYELSQVTFEKQEKIWKDNVGSEFQYLESKYRLDQNEANYNLMKARYGKTFIKAPFDGVLDNKSYEAGEFASPGMPIIDIISTYRFKVEAGVPERYVGKINKGDKATLNLKNVDSGTFTGKVTYVGSSVLVDNRTFPVEILIDSKSKLFKPELAVEVNVIKGEYDNMICVPDEVVSRVDEGYVVFVEEDGKAQSRPIEIQSRFGDKIAIKSGLNEGENLITIGFQNLVHGQKVTVVN
jgi:RND family efflux transporter MFP subunit